MKTLMQKQILDKNYELILVDDLSEGSALNLPKVLRKKLIRKRIQDIKKLKINKLNGIFHLAAQSSVPSFLAPNQLRSSSTLSGLHQNATENEPSNVV